MLNLNNIKKYACKYRVDSFIIMMGKENIKLDPSNILSIEYINNYEFNIRAMLKVNIRIDIRKKIWILKNKRNIKIKFELVKLGMDIESESFVSSPETVWNCIFSAYFNDEDESSDISVMEERINMNEGGSFASEDIHSENYFESQNVMDLFLFNSDILNASNYKYNGVFTKDILQNCVARILTSTKHKNVLMSPFENNEIYQELIVPALPAYKSLIYLDQYYGFYETGAMIYYDVDTVYILNTNGSVTAKRNNESAITCIYITTLDNSQPGNGMFKTNYKNDNSYPIEYISINESNINLQKPSIGFNETIGSETKFIISDDISINTSSANQSVMSQRNENIFTIRKADNKFVANIAKARMEENECILYFNGENIDINSLTPNKQYQVVYEESSKNQKYGKYKYRLSYASHYITLRSEKYMDASHRFVLKRSVE